MPAPRNTGLTKRQKERVRQERQQKKAEKKAERKATQGDRTTRVGGEDPDIAGIVPGPQPRPWEDDGEAGSASDEHEDEEEGAST